MKQTNYHNLQPGRLGVTCNKIKYPSKADANKDKRIIQIDAKRHKGAKSNGSGVKKMWVYYCGKCCYWHLTSRAPVKYLDKRFKSK